MCYEIIRNSELKRKKPVTIITDETKRTRNHQNAGKECEKVGQAGRVPDGGIKL